MANKKKIAASAVAVATAAALALGGTFAWQSINQTALNEASDIVNPGGRLHDDFNGSNKDIYVENFADEPIYARIQLSEYMEIVMNYGVEGAQTSDYIKGSKNDDGTYNYETYKFDGNVDENGVVSAAVDEDGYAWWNWTTGGSTVYMPTFNMNKDSFEADINGIYEDGNVGTISDRILDMTDENAQYSEYKEYTDGETLTGTEIYDGDVNSADEIGDDFDNLGAYAEYIVTVSEDDAGNPIAHTAKNTLDAKLISMDEWVNDYNSEAGPYWVYDTDGWVYWAQAIEPHTATGLLLDGIELSDVMDDTWYYAINVVAQFVTADDVGKTDGTGFYDTVNGTVPTTEAEALLEAIGVDMSGEAAGDNTTDDFANGFRIYSVNDDEGTNYNNEDTASISAAGNYTMYVSSGEAGKYDGANPDAFAWDVSPAGLTVSSSVSEYEAGVYYVSASFTLDSTVPVGTYTITATNETDGITRTAYIEWAGEEESGTVTGTLTFPDPAEIGSDGYVLNEETGYYEYTGENRDSYANMGDRLRLGTIGSGITLTYNDEVCNVTGGSYSVVGDNTQVDNSNGQTHAVNSDGLSVAYIAGSPAGLEIYATSPGIAEFAITVTGETSDGTSVTATKVIGISTTEADYPTDGIIATVTAATLSCDDTSLTAGEKEIAISGIVEEFAGSVTTSWLVVSDELAADTSISEGTLTIGEDQTAPVTVIAEVKYDGNSSGEVCYIYSFLTFE